MKELKDIVHDLKYAKKLKELGVKQDSIHHWIIGKNSPFVYNHERYVSFGGIVSISNCSAFTSEELREKMKGNGVSIADYEGMFVAVHSPNDTAQTRRDKKPCNALAKMLIYLIENKLMEVA